jgi:ornithine carbamoyltransferase
MEKTRAGNFFEDFAVGQVFQHAVPRTVTEGDLALYIALTGDRRPLHCSAKFARSLGFPRQTAHDLLLELAEHAQVPVINALTPLHHPCQALADLLTLKERTGGLEGVRLAYVGDGNNVCHSLMLLGARAGVQVAVATPPALRPDEEIVREAGPTVELTNAPRVAAKGAHALYTDVWVSMGDEAEARSRRELLAPYQLNEELFSLARDDAVVMHCLPAHPGEEISEALLYGERSAVWDPTENRLHAQKALIELLLG